MEANEVWQWIIFAGALVDTREAFGITFAAVAFAVAIVVRMNIRRTKIWYARRKGRRVLTQPRHEPRARLVGLLETLDYVYSEQLTKSRECDTYLASFQHPDRPTSSLQILRSDNDRYGRDYDVTLSTGHRVVRASGDEEHRVTRRGYRWLADMTHVECTESTGRFLVDSLEPEIIKEAKVILNALPESFADEVEYAIKNWSVSVTAK